MKVTVCNEAENMLKNNVNMRVNVCTVIMKCDNHYVTLISSDFGLINLHQI